MAKALYENDNAVFISDNGHVWSTINEMYGTPCYLWESEPSIVYQQVHDKSGSIYSQEMIDQWIEEGKQVYFAQYKNLTIDELIEDTDLQYVYIGTYKAEYIVDIYKIQKE